MHERSQQPEKKYGQSIAQAREFSCAIVRIPGLPQPQWSQKLALAPTPRRQSMEYRRAPGETTDDFGEGLDRDYIMAAAGIVPESALAELPLWAWAVCTAVLAVFTFVLFRIG
jgi:hypothetical protein